MTPTSEPISILLATAAPLLYVVAAVLIALAMQSGNQIQRGVGAMLTALAVVLHSALVVGQMVVAGGFTADFFSALSIVSLVVVALMLLAGLRFPLIEILPAALPGAALMLILQAAFGPEPTALALADPRAEAHVIASLLAYSVLLIAALNAIFLYVQHRLLHHHRSPTLLGVLPPLTIMESLLIQLIAAGWILLTISLGSGLLFVDNLFAQHLVHKTVLSILAWLIFGVLLFGRWRFGWRGRKIVHLCLAGMAVLLLAYFGSKAVLELMLDRRWQAGG